MSLSTEFRVTRWWSAQPPVEGFWGPSTSSIDWCEANYEITRFIAEFTNTLTNFVFVTWALYGVKKCRDERLPLPLALCQFGIALIGVGSFLFHATLRYEWQMGDELPMIFCCAFTAYVAFDTGSAALPRTSFVRCLPYMLSLYSFAFTAIYLKYPNPVFHQVAYGALQIIAIIRLAYTVRASPSVTVQQQKNKSDATRCVVLGGSLFLAGFFLWNIDNIFCDKISLLKQRFGIPWSFVLEGHAWWHLTSGTGAYLIVIGLQLITLSYKEGADKFEMRRGGLCRLCPYVARIPVKID